MRGVAWLVLGLLCAACASWVTGEPPPERLPPAPSTTIATTVTPPPPEPVTDEPAPVPIVAAPATTTIGLLQFRGSPSRTWYGTGPVPETPRVAWRYPDRAMCGISTVGDETKQWCGTGWTGQPAVWVRPDGITEVVFGAYDGAVHFVDAGTGRASRPPFQTGDLIKGSVTIDPDGYPLLYFGSRDNRFRVVALDRDVPIELWSIDAADHPGIWNNDWDGNPAIVDGVLYEGGENGILFAVELNRGYEGDGAVAVDPEILVKVEAWNSELLAAVGDSNASIEGSVAIRGDRLYVANSAGRVIGVDISAIRAGAAPIVFDWWGGDDIDATVVVDPDGSIYVASELERFLTRSAEVGQLVKLDPDRADDPLVWSVPVPPAPGGNGAGGLWATPALGAGVVYAATHPGELLVVDAASGEVVWRDDIGHNAWSSPVVVDDRLVVATSCEEGGALRAYDVSDPRLPVRLWDLPLESGCVESTPALWNGTIYVGSRDGFFYAISE